jgi:predicted HD superfamily hydrolase involved in NAD metabolism
MTAPAEDLVARLRRAVDVLPKGLQEHIGRVEAKALELAACQGVDSARVTVAVLGHDLARAVRPGALSELARRYGVEPDDLEEGEPILLHGPVAARMLASEYGVRDEEVLAAAAWHTTARAGMSRLEKVLFLADKLEPEKVDRRPAWAEVERLAGEDLDAAVLRFLDLYLGEALERGWPIHPRTVAARNELLAARRR